MEALKNKGQIIFGLVVVISILLLVTIVALVNIVNRELVFTNIINKIPGVFSGTLSALNLTLYNLNRSEFTLGTATVPFFGTNPYNPIAYFNIPQVAPIYGIEVEYLRKGFLGSYNPFQQISMFFEWVASQTKGTIESLKLQPK